MNTLRRLAPAVALIMLLAPPVARAQSLSPEDDPYDTAIRTFSICLNKHAQTANFAQPDDLSSALTLMRECRASWNAYLKNCLASGEDGNTCAFLGVGLARSAADLKGQDLPMPRFGSGRGFPSLPAGPWSR